MAPSAAARKAGGSLQRGCWYYRWADETDSTEEGFRAELTLKLDLEALTILRRKNILETEKSPVTERHQCVNQIRYQTADGVAGRARSSSNSIQNGISSPPGGRD